jgi:DNA-binding transcriptional LysR family regulator
MSLAEPDIRNTERPVQVLNTPVQLASTGIPEGARWDDLRVAIVLHDAGSFRRSADRLRITINTVRTRLDRLEACVGMRLFLRSPKGVRATPAGLDLVAVAQRMQKNAATMDADDTPALLSPGELRIGASESIGVLWLAPRLAALQDKLAGRTANLSCSYDLQRDRSLEVDLDIGFRRATNPDMISARIATLHFMLFASRRYLALHGTPEMLADLPDHRFIEQTAPGINSHVLDFLIGTDHKDTFVPIRTNSGLALFSAVTRGEGIALMPTYVLALDEDLAALPLPVQLRFDIFLSYRAELRNAPPVMQGVQWLRDIFSPVGQPWFAERFVHPDRMGADAVASTANQQAGIFLNDAIR